MENHLRAVSAEQDRSLLKHNADKLKLMSLNQSPSEVDTGHNLMFYVINNIPAWEQTLS